MGQRAIIVRKRIGKGDIVPSFFWDDNVLPREEEERIKKGTKKQKEKILNCDNCPQKDSGRGPVLGFGPTNTGFLWLGRDPGGNEVRFKKPFVGQAGKLLREICKEAVKLAGWINRTPLIDALDGLVRLDNIAQCQPNSNIFSKKAAKHCYDRLEQYIETHKPKVIVTLGREATERILGHCNSIKAFADMPIPSHKYRCIVYPVLHPSFILRQLYVGGVREDYVRSLAGAFSLMLKVNRRPKYVGEFLASHTLDFKTKRITTIDQLANVVSFIKENGRFAFDVENNTAKVYTRGSKDYIWSLATSYTLHEDREQIISYWMTAEEEFRPYIKELLEDKEILKVIQNVKHEDLCARVFFDCENGIVGPTYCTMVNRHLVDSRAGNTSLKTQVLQKYGMLYKHKTDPKLEPRKGEKFNRIEEIPVDVLGARCAIDAAATFKLYREQLIDFIEADIPVWCMDFYSESVKTFTNYETRGIKVDVDRLNGLIRKYTDQVFDIEKEIFSLPRVRTYMRDHGTLNLNSDAQLRVLLFSGDYYKLHPLKRTKKKQEPSVDQETLEHFSSKNIFCRKVLERRRFKKLLANYLKNVLLYMGGDAKVHPSFWLHIAETYRSSASQPSLQNWPKRYEVSGDTVAKEVRSIFVSSFEDGELVEVDYSGNEVKGLAMLCRDPQLIEDLNAGLDMHRYFASLLFEKEESEITKEERFQAKNSFVFATLYGASATSIAANMEKGEFFIAGIQNILFSRYPKVKEWHNKVYNGYLENGYVELLTGFKRKGPLDWNQIINTPIQGTAFHLLLDSCNRIEMALEKSGLRARAICQIHDSILFDAPKAERKELVAIVDAIMTSSSFSFTKGIKLETEWQAGPNWGEMEDL